MIVKLIQNTVVKKPGGVCISLHLLSLSRRLILSIADFNGISIIYMGWNIPGGAFLAREI